MKLPKVNGNNFFAPFILIYSLIITYQVSSLEFVERDFSISFILSIGLVITLLKVFIITFKALEDMIKEKKSFLLAFQIFLAVGQYWLVTLALIHLTTDKFPQTAIQWLAFSNLLFLAQSFLTKAKISRTVILSILLYLISYIALYFKFFENDLELFILMQQAISYIVVICEAVLFILIAKNFVDFKGKD